MNLQIIVFFTYIIQFAVHSDIDGLRVQVKALDLFLGLQLKFQQLLSPERCLMVSYPSNTVLCTK